MLQQVSHNIRIVVDSDYDSYFANLVRSWVARKHASGAPFKHNVIRITAGPWRSSAVTYRSNTNEIHLDFYSAIRTGFGKLTAQDVEAIIALL